MQEIENRDLKDGTLVGHGWGGYPMTGGAHALSSRVSKVVCFNALVPEKGVPLMDEN